MKFKDYEYKRLDAELIQSEYKDLLEKFDAAKSVDEQEGIIKKINDIRKNAETMINIVYIRHSINTEDEFYKKEWEFINEVSPVLENEVVKYYKAILNSKFRKELEERLGSHLFNLADLQIKCFSEEIIEDAIAENKLVSEYDSLVASAKIEFKGNIYNISQMKSFLESKDRDERKEAYLAVGNFFGDNSEKFDEIYDSLVKVRDKMAKKLGYENFVQMGYDRMHRSDYDSKMVKVYRDQIYKHLVPIAQEIKEKQRKRLGFEKLKYYDESLEFNSGNANPKGDEAWMIDNAKRMYRELSPETKEFFDFMSDRELMDLEGKKGKMAGGYCTSIPNYESPFIFANFNGTSGDVTVLTHEAGHAFQAYRSRKIEVFEYINPTLEACEIHSMSMEFITWPWMELFFKEDVKKFKYSHLTGAVSFIPYGTLVDEYQHFVYENPEVSPSERNSKWRELEKKYLPHKDYDGNEIMESGKFWYRQGHIFSVPFYYIDYTLAQICAFQFWIKMNTDKEKGWKEYLELCTVGGSMPFTELLEYSNLNNPFKEGTIKPVMEYISNWLNEFDDSDLV